MYIRRRDAVASLAIGILTGAGGLRALSTAAENVASASKRPGWKACTFALLHSPLVGSHTWDLVADRLRRDGHRAIPPSLTTALERGPPYYDALASAAARAIGDLDEVILVGHSAAGGLLPSVMQHMSGSCAGAIFVDAILPHPGRSWMDTAPPALRQTLAEKASEGRVPAWDRWLLPGVLDKVLADQTQRAAFIADLPSVPLDYLLEAAPAIATWPPRRCAYLRLSAGYEREAADAERLGWRVARESLNHLALLTHAAVVSERLECFALEWWMAESRAGPKTRSAVRAAPAATRRQSARSRLAVQPSVRSRLAVQP